MYIYEGDYKKILGAKRNRGVVTMHEMKGFIKKLPFLTDLRFWVFLKFCMRCTTPRIQTKVQYSQNCLQGDHNTFWQQFYLKDVYFFIRWKLIFHQTLLPWLVCQTNTFLHVERNTIVLSCDMWVCNVFDIVNFTSTFIVLSSSRCPQCQTYRNFSFIVADDNLARIQTQSIVSGVCFKIGEQR